MRQRLSLCVIAALAVILSTGCRETFARVVGAGVVTSYQGCASEPMLPVGDSMQFTAQVGRSQVHSLSFNPLDGVTLYASESNPGAFAWRVWLPRDEPRAGLEGRGDARITQTGMLVAEQPGYVVIYARSAGTEGFSRYLVVPRVLRMAVAPRDTTLRVGDTVTVRLDAAVDAPWTGRYAVWNLIGQGSDTEAVAGAPPPDLSSHTRRFVGIRPGSTPIEVCVAGTRRDTIMLHVTERR